MPPFPRLRRGLAVAALALLAAAPRAGAVETLCVNVGGTDGCFAAIRDAIDAAPPTARIDVAAGTYAGLVPVLAGRNVTIRGAGSAATVVDAEHVWPSVVHVEGGRLVLSGMTLRNGSSDGMTVTERGRADVEELIVAGTPATGFRVSRGSRLRASDVTVIDSNVGVQVFDRARAKIAGCRLVRNNTGIIVTDSRVEVIDTRIRGGGDGIDSTSSHVTLRRARVVDNQRNGITMRYPRAAMTISESTIAGNGNGDLAHAISSDDARSLRIERSTIANNTGTGVRTSGRRTHVLDSTITGNARGISPLRFPFQPNRVDVFVDGSTITGNLVGILCVEGNCASIASTILADNTAADCSGAMVSRGFNLVENLGSCAFTPAASDLIGVDPQLAPLADNGGPTRTQALLPASPARGAVGAAHLCRRADQRGEKRRKPCDVGAYESDAVP